MLPPYMKGVRLVTPARKMISVDREVLEICPPQETVYCRAAVHVVEPNRCHNFGYLSAGQQLQQLGPESAHNRAHLYPKLLRLARCHCKAQPLAAETGIFKLAYEASEDRLGDA